MMFQKVGMEVYLLLLLYLFVFPFIPSFCSKVQGSRILARETMVSFFIKDETTFAIKYEAGIDLLWTPKK